MSRNKKRQLKPQFLIVAALVLLFVFLLFTNPGRYFVSWVFEKITSERSSPEKITRIGIQLPEEYSVFGIDVSRYQNKIEWNRVADFKSGQFTVEFVFMKATEGTSLKDPNFAANWKGTSQNQIPRGAYHFFRPRLDAEKQANHFCRNVKMQVGDLPPVLDVEEIPAGMSKTQLVNSVKIWLQIVERNYNIKPIVYTGANFYEEYFRGTTIEKYPLWVAHYYQNQPATFANWKFWQFSDKASIDGVSGPVDANVFSGTSAQLNAMRKK
jgi:lysozyme